MANPQDSVTVDRPYEVLNNSEFNRQWSKTREEHINRLNYVKERKEAMDAIATEEAEETGLVDSILQWFEDQEVETPPPSISQTSSPPDATTTPLPDDDIGMKPFQEALSVAEAGPKGEEATVQQKSEDVGESPTEPFSEVTDFGPIEEYGDTPTEANTTPVSEIEWGEAGKYGALEAIDQTTKAVVSIGRWGLTSLGVKEENAKKVFGDPIDLTTAIGIEPPTNKAAELYSGIVQIGVGAVVTAPVGGPAAQLVGKAAKPAGQAISKIGPKSKKAVEVAGDITGGPEIATRFAVADFLATDPNSGNLLIMENEHPVIMGLIEDWSEARDLNDPQWRGRLHNAIEGIIIGTAFGAGMEVMRPAARAGMATAKELAGKAIELAGPPTRAAYDTTREFVGSVTDQLYPILRKAAQSYKAGRPRLRGSKWQEAQDKATLSSLEKQFEIEEAIKEPEPAIVELARIRKEYREAVERERVEAARAVKEQAVEPEEVETVRSGELTWAELKGMHVDFKSRQIEAMDAPVRQRMNEDFHQMRQVANAAGRKPITWNQWRGIYGDLIRMRQETGAQATLDDMIGLADEFDKFATNTMTRVEREAMRLDFQAMRKEAARMGDIPVSWNDWRMMYRDVKRAQKAARDEITQEEVVEVVADDLVRLDEEEVQAAADDLRAAETGEVREPVDEGVEDVANEQAIREIEDEILALDQQEKLAESARIVEAERDMTVAQQELRESGQWERDADNRIRRQELKRNKAAREEQRARRKAERRSVAIALRDQLGISEAHFQQKRAAAKAKAESVTQTAIKEVTEEPAPTTALVTVQRAIPPEYREVVGRVMQKALPVEQKKQEISTAVQRVSYENLARELVEQEQATYEGSILSSSEEEVIERMTFDIQNNEILSPHVAEAYEAIVARSSELQAQGLDASFETLAPELEAYQAARDAALADPFIAEYTAVKDAIQADPRLRAGASVSKLASSP